MPEFRSGYEDLGARWRQLTPSEIEQASVTILDELYRGPMVLPDLESRLGLDRRGLSIASDVMKAGHLLSVQPVDGQPVVYSPLAVDGNPNAYINWARKFPDDVSKLLKTLGEQQGLPLNDPLLRENPALMDAISAGVLMPVQVTGTTGPQGFLFAPRGGLAEEERTILDKARAILACVRYGSRFAAGRAVKYPRRILETLRDRRQFGKGHPDLFAQYGLLVEKLIGHPVKEAGNRWNFRVDDTPENMKALQVAIEMLEHGESPSARIDLDAQRALLSPSGYLGPLTARPRLAESISASGETRAEIVRQMARLARGMTIE